MEIYVYKRYAAVAKYTGEDRLVVIPKYHKGVPVTEILPNAFAHNDHIEGVFIPDTMQRVGSDAFANCRKLCYIGSGASGSTLANISALPENKRPDLDAVLASDLPILSVLPRSLQTIEAGAFAETALKDVLFKAPVITFGDSAFEGCLSLDKVTLFDCTSLELGMRVFMNSTITRFYGPNIHLNIVPEYTFANCRNLVSVLVHINGVGTRSFYQCKQLKTLIGAPEKMRNLGPEAFAGCDQLEGFGKPTKAPGCSVAEPDKHVTIPKNIPSIPKSDLQSQREELFHTLYKIAENAKGLKKMDNENCSVDDIMPMLDDSLFVLNIDYCGNVPKPVPFKITGVWRQSSGTYYFSIHSPSVLSEVRLQALHSESLDNIIPILDYTVKQHIEVTLLGKHSGHTFSVYKITPSATEYSLKSVSPEFFHEMVERVKKPVPKGLTVGAMLPPFAIRTEEEFDTFIEVCGERLPFWVVKSYRKNKETLSRRGGFNDDEKKHARRSLEILTNIDWLPHVVNLPTVEEARKILDASFYGLEKVKTRIEEIIAQARRTGLLPKWGILLNGPAGTGKTSIAKAMANVFGMQLIQMDMSSLGDDAEAVSGTPRIYSNARPGMLLESMMKIRSSTAVLLANEVDKAGEGKSGPSAANILLTILDKTGFYENFLEEIIPTDNLFCIATSNNLDQISKPLRDRFLIIDIPGYTPNDKKAIFKNYVLPLAMEKSGIEDTCMAIDEAAVELLVCEYAVEPGARDLEQYAERLVGDYCRYSAIAGENQSKRVYTVMDIKRLLGPGRTVIHNFAINPGEVNAAFYHNGKAHFFLVEALVAPGSGKFEVLGPMAKIQEDYAKVAYMCVRNTTTCDLSQQDVTIFIPDRIPEGAHNHVGLACYVAICSKLLNVNLALRDICFIGGCDMNGSLYFSESDLTPLLCSMKTRGVSTLYAPMGTNQLLNSNTNHDCNVTIIEGPDAKTILSLAVARNQLKS